MDQLLRFLLEHCLFLFERDRFMFVESETFESFNDADIILESSRVRLMLSCERGDLFLDFQGVASRSSDWYSVDLVRQLVLKTQARYSSQLNASTARFLRRHLETIETLFSRRHIRRTTARLRKLKRLREGRMWG